MDLSVLILPSQKNVSLDTILWTQPFAQIINNAIKFLLDAIIQEEIIVIQSVLMVLSAQILLNLRNVDLDTILLTQLIAQIINNAIKFLLGAITKMETILIPYAQMDMSALILHNQLNVVQVTLLLTLLIVVIIHNVIQYLMDATIQTEWINIIFVLLVINVLTQQSLKYVILVLIA